MKTRLLMFGIVLLLPMQLVLAQIITDEHSEFVDFQDIYQAGMPIQFIIENTSYTGCGSFNAKISDRDANIIWGEGADALCDPPNGILRTYEIKIGYNEDHPLIINESGKYYIEVEYDNGMKKREFKVRQNTAGGTIDRTVYLNPHPVDLWSNHETIIDGTIIDIVDYPAFHIQINKVFKGATSSNLITAISDEVSDDFKKGDTGLFYISDTIPSKSIYKYAITSFSVKTNETCTARDFMEMGTLPTENPPRAPPTRSESYFDPCIANYFTYDPDFFHGIHNGITPLKQMNYGIPNDMIRCYGDLVKITKPDGSRACVKPESVSKLIERGWESVGSVCLGGPSRPC